MRARPVVLLLMISIVVIAGIGPATAHDTETAEGYEVTFGGADEPMVTGERMWLELEVVEADSEEPVEDLDDSLTLAVQEPFGSDTRQLDVSSRFEPGWYEAPIIFTEPGTYTVYVNGSIDGAEIDLSFQSQVENASALEYPSQDVDREDRGTGWIDDLPGIAVGAAVAAIGMAVAFLFGRRM